MTWQDSTDLVSKIQPNSARAALIREACAIVWEELAGANIAALHCCDELCRAVKACDKPFGGIPFVGLGDFRQVAPVVKGQGLSPALQASVKSSYLWPQFRIFTLEQPYRSAQDPEYTSFVDLIGEDYQHPTASLRLLDTVHSLDEMISFLYPPEILNNPVQCLKRAFLSPKNIYVDDFNDRILDQLPGESGEQFFQVKFDLEPHEISLRTSYKQYHTTVPTRSRKMGISYSIIHKPLQIISRSSKRMEFQCTSYG